MFGKKGKNNIHLDYAATTPVASFVLKKMQKFMSEYFYNPSSIYLNAKEIKNLIEDYRSKIAQKLQIKNSEIIFTNGGTESINIAILGIAKSGGHIITTKIEHPAVLETLKEAERLGCEITYLDVDEGGLISLDDLKNNLKPETKLITIAYVSNETGVIQPIKKISREILRFKESLNRNSDQFPYFHVDASQAGLTEDLNMNSLRADMMTLDASKIYGPKGTGVLIKKNYVELKQIIFGGGQEQGLRPGTENVAGIVGFSEALLWTFDNKEKNKKHFEELESYMISNMEKEIPEAKLNGNQKYKVPQILNFCIEGLNSEFTVIMMDEKGINCSQMTACKSNSGIGQSYVIENISGKECAGSSIRFSFGLDTTQKDIDKAIQALKETIIFQL